MEKIFGSLTLLIAVAVLLAGLSVQININRINKKVGMRLLTTALPLGICVIIYIYSLECPTQHRWNPGIF